MDSSLHVDGEVEGTISSNSNLSIGTGGKITGDITAASVIVSGAIEGTIRCQHLHIVSDGKVSGDVFSKELTIETGGQFLGKSHPAETSNANAKTATKPAAETQKPEPKPAAKSA